ncbi:hypothetical protein SPRG_10768 [Saprolegnia parasitica CBS 223.65]|uniref:Dynactin subunit 6 n=1 Tax=Saprolegnia parasitica (strain CBS 223.65) TaxID=695850 RepID=A0A067BZ65_SAPPC|nr:hypothetical protein SPRG_10768 [Saprolegnia parasitica CBS 223.65]KDO23573.1 hypothetical protein SPRG_10768 [Saprolegnia parasitica CBS 223.65]|eukprot:XP_012205722.1 hypothetical protein SPRG_10768 [Saprolegnia parasitica CBS 223.65]
MYVCDEAQVDLAVVTVGYKSVFHPKAAVEVHPDAPSSSPPYVIFGERNIVDDMACISLTISDTQSTITVGDNNLFESGCTIKAKTIGSNNWFEPKCSVGEGVVIGNDCVIGAGVVVPPHTVIPDSSVLVRLPDGRIIRREQKEYARKAKQMLQDKYIDAFTEATSPSYLPRNHRMKTKP